MMNRKVIFIILFALFFVVTLVGSYAPYGTPLRAFYNFFIYPGSIITLILATLLSMVGGGILGIFLLFPINALFWASISFVLLTFKFKLKVKKNSRRK